MSVLCRRAVRARVHGRAFVRARMHEEMQCSEEASNGHDGARDVPAGLHGEAKRQSSWAGRLSGGQHGGGGGQHLGEEEEEGSSWVGRRRAAQ